MPPPNDDFVNAIDLGSSSTSVSWTNVDATLEVSEIRTDNGSGTNSIWYKITGSTGDRIKISLTGTTEGGPDANILAPNHYLFMEVYTGSAVNALTHVRLTSGYYYQFISLGTTQDTISFDPTTGVTYYLQISSYYYNYGIVDGGLDMTVAPIPPPPSNNDFANAIQITGTSGSVSGSALIDANLEPGEPLPFNDWFGMQHTVWYYWIAPADGILSLTVTTDVVESEMGLWRGNTLDSLVIVAGDDDSFNFDTNEFDYDARLAAQVKAGQRYNVQLGSYANDVDIFSLSWSFVTGFTLENDSFENAIELLGSSGTVSGTLKGASRQEGEPVADLGALGFEPGLYSVWYKITVTENATVTVTVPDIYAPDTKQGIILGAYSGTSLTNLVENVTDGTYEPTLTISIDDPGDFYIYLASPTYGYQGPFTLTYGAKAGILPWLDRGTNVWRSSLIHRLPDLPRPRHYGTAVTIEDYVAFIGGENDTGELAAIDMWDIKAGEWITSFIPPLPEARSEPVVVSFYPATGASWTIQRIPVDQRPAVYVVGGRLNGEAKKQTWMWQWGDTEWTSLPDMPTARYGAAGTVLVVSQSVASQVGPYATGWRYLRLAKGATPPTGWQNPGFDDSGWSVGQGGFGSGTLGDPRIANTYWATGVGGVEDLYVRRVFPANRFDPKLIVNVDDTASIYINGSLWISSGYTSGLYNLIAFIPPSARGTGDYLIAVKVVDTGAGASYFDLEVQETIPEMPALSVVGGAATGGSVVAAHEAMYLTTYYPLEYLFDEFAHTWRTFADHPEPHAGWRYVSDDPYGYANPLIGGRDSLTTFFYHRDTDMWVQPLGIGIYYNDLLDHWRQRGMTFWDSGVAGRYVARDADGFIANNLFMILGGDFEAPGDDYVGSPDIQVAARKAALGAGVLWGSAPVYSGLPDARVAARNPGFWLYGGGVDQSGQSLSDFWFFHLDYTDVDMRVPVPAMIDISYMKTVPDECFITAFTPVCFQNLITTSVQSMKGIGPLFPGTPVEITVNGLYKSTSQGGGFMRQYYKPFASGGGAWYMYVHLTAAGSFHDDIRVKVRWRPL